MFVLLTLNPKTLNKMPKANPSRGSHLCASHGLNIYTFLFFLVSYEMPKILVFWGRKKQSCSLGINFLDLSGYLYPLPKLEVLSQKYYSHVVQMWTTKNVLQFHTLIRLLFNFYFQVSIASFIGSWTSLFLPQPSLSNFKFFFTQIVH